MNDIRQRLFGIFQAEHAEHLRKIRSILALAAGVEGPGGGTDLDEAFRRAHSLKGAARAVDLPPVEGLAHRLETLFSRVREGTLHLDGNVTRVIHQVLDSSEDCMAAFSANRIPSEPLNALQAIEGLLGLNPETPASPAPSSALPPSPAKNDEPAQPALPAGLFQSTELARVRVDDLNRLVQSTGQLLTETFRQSQVTEQVRKMGREISVLEAGWGRLRKNLGTRFRASFTNAEVAPTARSVDSIDRQLRFLAKQSRATALLQRRSTWAVRRLAEQLQQDVWSARMVAAETFFEGFERMVRDLAREERKQIDFRVEGLDVRADRVVLQALKDPVMHLLRNAISHGIETPEERCAKGKIPTGALTLRIRSERSQLVIGVNDDGRGIDFGRVSEVGIERGLLSATERDACSPQDLARMIFQPGFSTATSVTALSGRGMGLSVALEAARRLQGDVNLLSKDGPGTWIVLTVPLSVSSHRLLLISCQGQSFGIPTHGIDRLYRVKAKQLESVQGKFAASLGGRQFPLFSLTHLLGRQNDADEDRDVLPVMLLKSGSQRAAVLVDAFLNQRDALIQDLGIPALQYGIVTGAVLLEDGAVCMVLNPQRLIERSSGSEAPLLRPARRMPEKVPARILVVDDSITTRSLEKSILEAHGYGVRVAVDGVEALRLLREEKADLVISDIEMPHMNGFELLKAIKEDKTLHRTPVIIVSSVERTEDQERGLALGADAYIVKRSFEQRELLETIQQLV